MFRIPRMTGPALKAELFTPREIKAEERPWHTSWIAPEKNMTLVMRFGPGAESRLQDWFEPEEISVQPDGSILLKSRMPDTGWVDSFVLGFGAAGEVLEPLPVRERIRRTICDLADLYKCRE